jgi:hypothetical protein
VQPALRTWPVERQIRRQRFWLAAGFLQLFLNEVAHGREVSACQMSVAEVIVMEICAAQVSVIQVGAGQVSTT